MLLFGLRLRRQEQPLAFVPGRRVLQGNDTQHNDTLHNYNRNRTHSLHDYQHNAGCYAGCRVFYWYAECRYAECRYSECRSAVAVVFVASFVNVMNRILFKWFFSFADENEMLQVQIFDKIWHHLYIDCFQLNINVEQCSMGMTNSDRREPC